MSTNVVTSHSGGGTDSIELDVTIVGMKVIVGAGTFRCGGQDYTFSDDQEDTIKSDATSVVAVRGFLARHRMSGDALLVVDEVTMDGVDQDLDFAATDYVPLHMLFEFRVPPKAKSLKGVDVRVAHSVQEPGES